MMDILDEKLLYEQNEGNEGLETSISFTLVGNSDDLDSFEEELKLLVRKLGLKHGVDVE
jgi:hypothetical protein